MNDLPTLIPLSKRAASGKRRSSDSVASPLLPHFVAGSENRLVAFSCSSDLSIVERGNPILLVGPSGSGKSAIARMLFDRELARYKSKPTCIAEPAIDFARHYANAVDNDTINTFRERYLNANVLLIEDVHMLTGKSPAQTELSSRVDQRIDRDLPTIFTCRRLPTEVDGLRSGLASRMLPGLTIPLQPPRSAARRVILAKYATMRKIALTEDQIVQLDRDLPTDSTAPSLCSAVQQLALVSLDTEQGEIADNVITEITTSLAEQQEPPISKIARTVARRYKLKTADLKSASRRQQVVRARSLAMFLGRQLTRQSLQTIGHFFGGRDHSTVIHAIRSTELLIQSDPGLARVADDVTEQLKAG